MPFTPTYAVPPERRAYTELAKVNNRNGRIGLLMLHGFLGSPLSSHPMANYLQATASAFIVHYCPGMGTTQTSCTKFLGKRG